MRADKVFLRLRGADPARGLEPASAAEREALRLSITAAPASGAQAPGRGRRGRRPLLVLAAGLLAAVAAAGAGAWALGSSAEESTTLTCAFDAESASMIDSATGDPIVDCEAEWRRLYGSAPPALVAYDTGGNVTVVRTGFAAPEEWTPLPGSFRQDARLIELDERLGDSAAGLDSGCFSLEEARVIAQRLLRGSGLSGWSVVYERRADEREGSCAAHALDRENRRVVLIPLDGSVGDPAAAHVVLSRRLAEATGSGCLSVPDAVQRVRREAAEFDWRESDGSLIINVLATDGCADIVVNVGGRVEVTIRSKRS